MADPADFPVQRLSTIYNTERTAVAKPFFRRKMNWDPTFAYPGSHDLNPGDSGGFLFRNPLRAAIIYQKYPAAQIFHYDWVFNPKVEPNEPTLSTQVVVTIAQQLDLEPVWGTYDPVASTSPPHGLVLYAGSDEVGHKYMWTDVQNGATILTVTWNIATTIAASIKIYVWKFDGGLRRLVTTSDSGAIGQVSNSINITTFGDGYYSLTILNGEPTSRTFQVYTTATAITASWNHLTIGDLNPDNINNVTEIRMHAASLLLQNEASLLNKQGKIVAVQAHKAEFWYEVYATRDTGVMYDLIATKPNSKQLTAVNGLYAFLKPSSANDLDYINPCIVRGGGYAVEDATYPLTGGSDYIAFAISCTAAGSADFLVTIYNAIEFRTNNNWLELRLPDIPQADWEQAIEGLVSMEQFFENPLHWSKIFATIGRIARVSAPVLARFPALNTIAPIVGAIGDMFQ